MTWNKLPGCKLANADCLEAMDVIPAGSVDLILCDLPYGTTACSWDSVIPFDRLWEHYKRVIKPNGAIVLTAAQPFTSALVMSNVKWFRYCWVWDKANPTGHLDCKRRPLRRHEDVVVFCEGVPDYYPQMRTGKLRKKGGRKDKPDQVYGKCAGEAVYNDQYYPTTILDISGAHQSGKQHPTQKPVPLMEYMINTYTLPGAIILDNCMGSGTTGVACVNLGRRFIGIEKDPGYFEIAKTRIQAAIDATTKP